MSFSPAGFAIGMALAERNDLPASRAAMIGFAGGVAGSTPAGLVLAVALAQNRATQSNENHDHLKAHVLAPPLNMRVRVRSLADRFVAEIDWAAVEGATGYIVYCYQRAGEAAKWERKEAIVVEGSHAVEHLISAGVSEPSVKTNYGFSVVATDSLGRHSSELEPVSVEKVK
jgi:hypothetical protein